MCEKGACKQNFLGSDNLAILQKKKFTKRANQMGTVERLSGVFEKGDGQLVSPTNKPWREKITPVLKR